MLLELTDVAQAYDRVGDGGAATAVLRGVNLRVDRGEMVAIVGPSGSGKTTLLNIIGTLDRPTSGRVTFEGRDLGTLNDRELAAVRNQRIGWVFQLHHLLPQLTVLENVLVPTLARSSFRAGSASGGDRRPPVASTSPSAGGGTSDGAAARARQLLDRVGLGARLDHRPGQLSGGECQRVAVVRALINKPSLVLADEPTGALDHAAALNLAQLLVDLNRDECATLLVVTHSMELASRMQRVLELRDGVLAPRGGQSGA